MGCDIWAETPVVGVSSPGVGAIVGVGHRQCAGPEEPTTRRVTVRIRQDRGIYWDKTLASVTKTVTDDAITVRYECQGTGSQTVFTEILVDEGGWGIFSRTKKARSQSVAANLCG
jgi:hypothetical protein